MSTSAICFDTTLYSKENENTKFRIFSFFKPTKKKSRFRAYAKIEVVESPFYNIEKMNIALNAKSVRLPKELIDPDDIDDWLMSL